MEITHAIDTNGFTTIFIFILQLQFIRINITVIIFKFIIYEMCVSHQKTEKYLKTFESFPGINFCFKKALPFVTIQKQVRHTIRTSDSIRIPINC